MKTFASLAILAVCALGMSQNFFDNFNRADGGLGANYSLVTGTTTVVSGNQATGGGAGNGLTVVNTGAFSASYSQMIVSGDLSLADQTSNLTFVALALGSNANGASGNGVYVKLQRQIAGGFSHIGFYTGAGVNNTSAITTTGGNFQTLASQIQGGRMRIMMTSATNLYTGIDTDFNGSDDLMFNSTLNLGSITLGNQAGLHVWGTAGKLDNFRATVVPEPATMAALGLGAVALIRRRRRKQVV